MEYFIIITIVFSALYCGHRYLYKITYSDPKIDIEMIPWEAQGFNVRSRVRDDQWRKICTVIHKQNSKRGQYRCQQCGINGIMQGFRHPVECHEIWNFDEVNHIQQLVGMTSICPLCHKAKHFGLAERSGFGDKVRQHMKKENEWNDKELNHYISTSKDIVRNKSGKAYTLDLRYLNKPEFYFLNTIFTSDERINCNAEIKY